MKKIKPEDVASELRLLSKNWCLSPEVINIISHGYARICELERERDEARKMCCELEARIIVLEEDRRDTSNKFGTNPCSEIILADSPLARYPKEIAKRKGWDCFKENTND